MYQGRQIYCYSFILRVAFMNVTAIKFLVSFCCNLLCLSHKKVFISTEKKERSNIFGKSKHTKTDTLPLIILDFLFFLAFCLIYNLFSSLNLQVNGAWSLPNVVCDFYIAMDVICSTSSIFNLVAISIDR